MDLSTQKGCRIVVGDVSWELENNLVNFNTEEINIFYRRNKIFYDKNRLNRRLLCSDELV